MSGSLASSEELSMVLIGGDQIAVTITDREDHFQVAVDGKKVTVRTNWVPGKAIATMDMNCKAYDFKVRKQVAGIGLEHGGYLIKAQVLSPHKAELARLMPVKTPADLSRFLLCPMPGLVTTLLVKEGDSIEPGQPLAIVEAMKMENVLQSEVTGKVLHVPVSAGDSLQVDQVIMEFEL